MPYRVEYKCRPDFPNWSLFLDRELISQEEARHCFGMMLSDESITDARILFDGKEIDIFSRELSEEYKLRQKDHIEDVWNNFSYDIKRYILLHAGVKL